MQSALKIWRRYLQADPNNYTYDAIGNLKTDVSEGITAINWTVYGKIASVVKSSGTISYAYDASGNRITKTAAGKTTLYIRDAGGNVMSVYEVPALNQIEQKELHLYGSSRLGMALKESRATVTDALATGFDPAKTKTQRRGEKFFELSNHLGNVLTTLTDKKLQQGKAAPNESELDYFTVDVASATDYYPFGMSMPGRKVASEGYRYGFNGKEKDNDISGDGNSIHFEFREYDPRISRFKSVDPENAAYAWQTPFCYHRNSPTNTIDYLGLGDPPGTIKQQKNVSDNTAYAPNGDLILMGNHRGKNPDKINTRSINLGTEEEEDYRVIYFEVEGGQKWTWDTGKKAYLNSDGKEFSNGLATAIFNKVGMGTGRSLSKALQNIVNGEPLKDTRMEYDQYVNGGGSGGWAGFIANGIKNGVSNWWDDVRAGGNRRRDAIIGFWQLTSSFAKGAIFSGGFSLCKQYMDPKRMSPFIRELELGTAKYPGTIATTKITADHLNALAENLRQTITKTMVNAKTAEAIQSQLCQPRWQYIDLLPDGARNALNSAINQLSKKGINVTFPY